MRWLSLATAALLTACTHQNAHDETLLEQQRAEAWSDTLFASVEEHAACAGFHRANAELSSEKKSTATFYATAASNAEIAAIEIAASELPKDLAVEMVNQLTETHAAEWAYAIELQAKSETVLAQAEKCQTLAVEQKNVVRDLIKAKYGLKKH